MPKYLLIVVLIFATETAIAQSDLANQVTIRRTDYGVPHVIADNLKAVSFGLAYAEMEDYGERVIIPLIWARGDLAKYEGYESIDSDFIRQQTYQRAVETYSLLSKETRYLMQGFAEGVNYYIKQNPDSFPQYQDILFSGYDVAAASTSMTTPSQARRFLNRLNEKKELEDSLAILQEEGSNVWAFAPGRTKSGHSILVRNPHLRWSAGYYEAHITVPGKLNFYGDFRIGGLFAIIGGFNDHLGWSTTNNGPDLDEIYSFDIDPVKPDHYLFDGISIPLQRKLVTAEFKNGNGLSLETREMLTTQFGPVVYRGDGKIIIIKQAGDGEYRRGEQFTRMMLAKNLEEWKDAMRMRAITSSNYTYADDQGNIFYVWNASIPNLPHASGKDTSAIKVSASDEVWTSVVSFDDLPQLLNPRGGYLHNENDPFHFTNLNEIISPEKYKDNFPEPRLRQRSQLSLQLIHNQKKFTLEEVVKMKHTMKMLLADQVKDDLLAHLKASEPDEETLSAITHLEKWDNSVAKDSRGGILFANWFWNYRELMEDEEELFAIPWDFNNPTETPDGLANPEIAVSAFKKALNETIEKYGTYDLAWGDVHRVRRGNLDFPVGGCTGTLGCFRVLWFSEAEDGKMVATGGDGWQFAVEFSNPPKAYSILAYGQTPNEKSPHHTDQLKMFSENKMKRVAFTERDIKKALIEQYTPADKSEK